MKIVIIGGTGLIGSRLVNRLRELGHAVTPASPASGVNSLTGEGLDDVLKGAEVVVDVSNAPSFEGQAAMDFFQKSTLNLLTAETYAGVRHHIALSVVGADRLTESGYMRAKVAQEDIIKTSAVPYTVLRSTQFFELAERIIKAGVVGEEIHISSAAFQPIASEEVVAALADLAVGAPLNTTVEVAGPECMPMYEFVRYCLNETEDVHRLVEDKDALYFGARLNDESLVPGDNARLGTIRFEKWLHAQFMEQ